MPYKAGGGREGYEAGKLAAGDETMHDFDGDENYKDLTIQKQNRGKIAAVFNFQPTDYYSLITNHHPLIPDS